MIQKLRQKYIKRLTMIFVILVIAVGFGVCFGGMGIIDWIKGSEPLTAESELADFEGKYVSWEMKCPLGELTAMVQGGQEGDDTAASNKKRIEYVALDAERESLIVVELPKERAEEAYQQMELFYETLNSANEMPDKGLLVEGTLEKLDEENYESFREALQGSGLDMEISEIYQIRDGMIKGMEPNGILLVDGMLLVFIIIVFGSISKFLRRPVKKTIEAYINSNPSVTMEELERDFSQAEEVKGLWMGRRFTFSEDFSHYFIENSEIVYTRFRDEGNTGGSSYYFYWYMLDGSRERFATSKKNCEKLLELTGRLPHVVASNSSEAAYLYKNEREKFLEIRYRNQNI